MSGLARGGLVRSMMRRRGAAAGLLDTTGSIFSMTAPLFSTAPLVAYDFTQYDSTKTTAQLLAAANLSGVSAYDLTEVGTISYPGNTPFEAPTARLLGAGSIGTNNGAYVRTAGAPAGLQLTGAMSVEWLGNFHAVPPGDPWLVGCGSPPVGGSHATNWLWLLEVVVAGASWTYFAEHDAGTDILATLFSFPANSLQFQGRTVLACMTRDASQNLRLYLNGKLMGAAVAAGAAPNEGSSAFFFIGAGSGAANRSITTYGVRVFNYELTAAQALESYTRTFYGEAST